ncbi:hypothetical protein CFN78_16950 [Amycolatopsis antarctica]|uniref:PE domain-containing protein n=1 Tax=Amycolatopsis antarctica TaxID=1854586 RepID=A0A263D2A2_9PSEU|nr:hypothetical protein [Amycolatopsis antarctica]OZM72208.1 hypothetical protein CFN78_16950 [Amycolatopsis antarctica]
MGDGFYAEPEGLKKMARSEMADLIAAVDLSRSELASTLSDDDNTFDGSGAVDGPAAEWTSARDLLLRVLEDNAENLTLARRALVEIADRYVAADEAAASGLRRAAGAPS